MSTPPLLTTNLSHNPSLITLVAPSPSPSSPTTQTEAPQPKKRYDFARGFSPDTTTIFEGLHPAYYLLDLYSLRRSKRAAVLLKDARTGGTLAVFNPKRFSSDIVTITSNAAHTKLRMKDFVCERVAGDSSLALALNIPDFSGCGLPTRVQLYWQFSVDNRFATLYSIADLDRGPPSILATASFSQSTTLAKIISIEVDDDVTETLLIYIFISASVIELDLGKRKRKEAQRWLGGPGTSSWTLSPFGIHYFMVSSIANEGYLRLSEEMYSHNAGYYNGLL